MSELTSTFSTDVVKKNIFITFNYLPVNNATMILVNGIFKKFHINFPLKDVEYEYLQSLPQK